MTKVEKDLYSIGRSVYRFYGTLTAIIVALPLLDRVVALLPPTFEQRTVASLAGTIIAIALIGYDYLNPRDPSIHGLPTGALQIIVGVILTIVYVGAAELIQQSRVQISTPLSTVFMVWYVALYGLFALGMWKMGWRAYRTKDQDIDLPTADTFRTAAL